MKNLLGKESRAIFGGTTMVSVFEIPGMPRILGLHLTTPVISDISTLASVQKIIEETSTLTGKTPAMALPPLVAHTRFGA